MAVQGYGIHGIRGARLVHSNLAIYLSFLLIIRYVSAAPTGTAPDNSNISPTVVVAIVATCLVVPSAMWAMIQIWQWFSGDNSGSPSGRMGNQVLPALQSNSGTIGNIYGGNWSQNEVPSGLGNRRRGVSPSQEGSEERDALLGTPDQSPYTRSSSSSDGESLELHGLNGHTALPYRDQQRAAHASVSVTVNGTTAPTESQSRMNLPADEDEGLLLQHGA